MNIFAIILFVWLAVALMSSPVLVGYKPERYTWGNVVAKMAVRATWLVLLVLAVAA